MNIAQLQNTINNYFSDLKFVEKNHAYFVNGKRIEKSVSTIVKEFSKPFDSNLISQRSAIKTGKSQEEILASWKKECDDSLVKGKSLHNFAEAYFIDNTLIPETDNQKKFVEYWNKIPKHIIPISSELKMYHKEYMFACTLDKLLYNTVNQELIIVDYKSNKDLHKNYKGQRLLEPFEDFLDTPLNKYIIQLNLYKILLKQIPGIHVRSMKIVWFDLNNNFQIFDLMDCEDRLLNALNKMYNATA